MAQTTRTRSGISKLKKRYDRSDVTIWTWYTKGDFPKPHYLNGVRQWWDDELDAWDEKHAQDYQTRQQELAQLKEEVA